MYWNFVKIYYLWTPFGLLSIIFLLVNCYKFGVNHFLFSNKTSRILIPQSLIGQPTLKQNYPETNRFMILIQRIFFIRYVYHNVLSSKCLQTTNRKKTRFLYISLLSGVWVVLFSRSRGNTVFNGIVRLTLKPPILMLRQLHYVSV